MRLTQDAQRSGFWEEETDLALGGDKNAFPRTDSSHSRTRIPTGSCRGQQTFPKMQGQGGRIFPGQGRVTEIKRPFILKAQHHLWGGNRILTLASHTLFMAGWLISDLWAIFVFIDPPPWPLGRLVPPSTQVPGGMSERLPVIQFHKYLWPLRHPKHFCGCWG